MKLTALSLSLLSLSFSFAGELYKLESPSSQKAGKDIPAGKSTITIFTTDNGQLAYSVNFDKKAVILDSPLGMNINKQDLGKNVVLKEVKKAENNSSYPYFGNHSTNIDHYKQVTLTLEDSATKENFELDVRAYPDGIAFRYRIPSEGTSTIHKETTTFTFPQNTHVWYASGPFQYGWLQAFQDRDLSKIKDELLAPPPTFKLADGTYASITESNLFNFHGGVLLGTAPNTIQMGFVENEGHLKSGYITGQPHPQYWHAVVKNVPWMIEGDITTPWRVIMLGKDLNELVNNDIVANTSNPPSPELFPEGQKTPWLVPGRATWTWLTEGDKNSIETYQKYIRGAAELKAEYVTIDEGWENWSKEGKDKWAILKEVCDYGKQHNVGIWVWRTSSIRNGNKNDVGLIPEGERRSFFKKCAEAGVKGLKIDFFHTENLFTVNLMENILKDAAKEKLLVIFHGVNKPTGDARTYPNLLAKEAVRGLECVGGENNWAPGPKWTYHTTVLPFTRWLVGAGDYTPMNFRSFCPADLTFAQQVASIYLLTSPMLIFAADIEDMLASPARTFIEDVPVTWDETIVLPNSRIGELAAIARRKGDIWYLAVFNGDKECEETFSLDFLPKGDFQLDIVADTPGERRKLDVQKQDIPTSRSLTTKLQSGGGYLVKCTPKK